jgi:MerR family mercuric resistance operon transcriptional regulator
MWISEAAEAAGVNVETVRYYERRGLLEQPQRPAEGYRHYTNETVQVVRFIKQAQDLGFTLEDIDELVRLRGTTPSGRERARAVAEQKLSDLERKMTQLRDMQTRLRRLVGACRAGNTPGCPILEAIASNTHSDGMDRAGRQAQTAKTKAHADTGR